MAFKRNSSATSATSATLDHIEVLQGHTVVPEGSLKRIKWRKWRKWRKCTL
jgi:hypothetical protein